MGGRTIIGDDGGGGGGAVGVSAAGVGAVSMVGLRQIVLRGFDAIPYPEVGRLDLRAMPIAVPVLSPSAAAAWALMPAALTELLGLSIHRAAIDLTGASEARLVANVAVAGAAGAELRVEWSPDLAAWAYLDGAAGPAASLAAAALAVSAWGPIDAAAAGPAYLRVVGIDGDGVASPSLGAVALQVR